MKEESESGDESVSTEDAKRKAKKHRGESEDDVPFTKEDMRAHLANQESRIARIQQELKKRDKKHRSRSSSCSSTSDSGSSKSSKNSKYALRDQDVENWRPERWPSNTDALRSQLNNISTRMLAFQPPGYMISEIGFLTELVEEVGSGASKKSLKGLKGIIGKRIIMMLTKLEAKGDFAVTESALKSKMMGRSSRHWGAARAKVLATARESRDKKGKRDGGKSFRSKDFRKKRFDRSDKANSNTKKERTKNE